MLFSLFLIVWKLLPKQELLLFYSQVAQLKIRILINMANEKGIAMVTTGVRHFKH